MADPFVAEIRVFPFSFAPKGWAFCDGQILPLSQNTALFSLLGTTYGGNGTSTFALPNLQGCAPLFWGQGPGLSLYDEGETIGSDTVTLLDTEMPLHSHTLKGQVAGIANLDTADANSTFGVSNGGGAYADNTAPQTFTQMTPLSISGASLPHNNLMPYLTLNFCIALQGVFPPRS
jgi:microcystin-dependent protein